MRKTRSIPEVTGVKDPLAANALSATKEIIEVVTGRSVEKIATLAVPAGASDVEKAIIGKLNEVINRLQA